MPRTQGLTALAVLHHVTAALALLSMIDLAQHPDSTGSMIVFAMQVAAFAFFSVIVRRGWAGIDGGAQGLSPAKAQGFLFIPFFNFYWIFPALVSLATQTNAKADTEKVSGARLTRGFGLVIAILFCVTSLTNLHASLAWLHFIIYATYLGFATTYIWQIRRSAAAFDVSSAPALREPAKMPTVGIAGIIYGSMITAILAIAILANPDIKPDTVRSELSSKGYTVEIENQSFAMVGLSRKDQETLGVSHLQKITVRDNEGRRVGTVQVMQCNKPAAEVKEAFEEANDTKSYFSGNHIFFDSRKNGSLLPFSDWLKSF